MQGFPARYAGTCGNCNKAINLGQQISWNRRGVKKTFHVDCQNPDAKPTSTPDTTEPTETDMLNDLSEVVTLERVPAKDMKDSTGQDAILALAMAIQPLIARDLNAKVDETKVRQIVAAEIAKLDQPTATLVINKRTDTEVKIDGLTHKMFAKLLALVSADANVYLYGAAGGGKTSAARQVSNALGLPFYMISLNIQSTPSLLFGYKNANGEYVETEFYKWYRDGGIFLFDEYDNTSGNLQTALNTALDNGHAAFPVGQVARHKDAICIAAGNTVGLGANGVYNSRQLMDGAARERFEFLAWDYDTKLETQLAKQANPKHGEVWALWVQVVRAYMASLNLKLVVSPRASLKGAKLLTLNTFTAEEIADLVLFKGIDKDTRSKVLTSNPLPRLGV